MGPGSLWLIVPLSLGWLLVRRALGERDPFTALTLAFPLAVALTLVGVNGLYRLTTLEVAVTGTFAAMAGGGLLLALARRAEPLRRPSVSPAVAASLALASLAILFFTNAQQIENPDDDYWIHTPLQGLMLHGDFPPTNPFFSDLPMNGHYGRNLSLVVVAWCTGLDTPLVQVLMTDLYQLATFLLLYTTFHRFTGSALQGLLGAGLMFFGIHVGGRGGLMDTLQNNNALVHLQLVLIVHLVLRAWGGSRAAAVLGGLALGGYAIVYETHFGLVVLAMAGSLPVILLREGRRGRALLGAPALGLSLLVLGVAVPLAVTQGGPLTEMFQRKVLRRVEVDVDALSKGLQNQAQVVKLQVPKRALFQILLEPGEYQRVSCAWWVHPWLQRLYTPSQGRGYRPIWSWEVLRIHWLPLFLSPWAAWVLVGSAHRAGLLLGAFGAISFLVPAVVDFGPIYESEYFRWQFAAGLGLAGALGLAAGQAFERVWGQGAEGGGRAWLLVPGGVELHLGRRELALLALIGLVWWDTLACRAFLWQKVHDLREGRLVGAWRLPETAAWIERHRVLDFHRADWDMARWLAERVRPGDRMLSNFSEENNFSILNESTLSGLSGARSVGHALPLDDEPIGTTPYHMAPPARAFWASLDPGLLRGLGVDWLYVREGGGLERALEGRQGLRRAHRTEDASGQRRLLYRVDLPPLAAGPVREGGSLAVRSLQLPPHLRNGEGVRGRLVVWNRGRARVRADQLFYEVVRRRTGKRTAAVERILQPVNLDLGPGEEQTLEIAFVGPHENGRYSVEWFAGGVAGVYRLSGPDLEIKMDFPARLRQLRLASLSPLGPLRAGGIGLFRVELENPGPASVDLERGVTGTVGVIPPGRDPGAGAPGRLLSELAGEGRPGGGVVAGAIPPGGRRTLVLGCLLPREPGLYRFDPGLAPREGGLKVWQGPALEVIP